MAGETLNERVAGLERDAERDREAVAALWKEIGALRDVHDKIHDKIADLSRAQTRTSTLIGAAGVVVGTIGSWLKDHIRI